MTRLRGFALTAALSVLVMRDVQVDFAFERNYF
jgi:hypothetical protein